MSIGHKLGLGLVGIGGGAVGVGLATAFAPKAAGKLFTGQLDRSDRTISYNRDDVQTNGPYNHTIWNTASSSASTAALGTGIAAAGISGIGLLMATKARVAQRPHVLAAATAAFLVGGAVSLVTANQEVDRHIVDPGKYHSGGMHQPDRG